MQASSSRLQGPFLTFTGIAVISVIGIALLLTWHFHTFPSATVIAPPQTTAATPRANLEYAALRCHVRTCQEITLFLPP